LAADVRSGSQADILGGLRDVSALPPKADMDQCGMMSAKGHKRSFDHLVGDSKNAGWDDEAERLGSLDIDDELEPGW